MYAFITGLARRAIAPAFLLLPLVTGLTACDSAERTAAPIVVGVPAAATIAPHNTRIEVGTQRQFDIRVTDEAGRPVDASRVSVWSSDPRVATISLNGIAAGIADGTATLNVAIDGKIADSATLVVGHPGAPIQGSE